MPDEKPVVKPDAGTEEVVDDDVQPEVDEDGKPIVDDDEELYDPKTGKPLPWANSKRFRKLYREAKQGKEIASVLNEAGLSASDLRGALSELSDFRSAYKEWKEAKDKGDTTPTEDADAAELKKREKAIADRLKEMGFLTKADVEAARQAERQEVNAQKVAESGREYLGGLLTTEGLISEDMEEDDIDEIMAEWDAKVGRRIMKSQADVRAFQSGDRKVIATHFKAALASAKKRGLTVPTSDRSKINDLPRRVGSGPAPRAKSGKEEKEPESIREAAAQMLKDMGGGR